MACNSEWITQGRTKTIQSTDVTVSSIFGNCDNIGLQFTLPWGKTGGDIYPKNGSPVKITNPSNTNEFITVRCTDTWCTSTGNTAKIEICYTAAALEKGTILCNSDTEDVSVFYNGKPISTPTNVRITGVPAGLHTIEYKKPDIQITKHLSW